MSLEVTLEKLPQYFVDRMLEENGPDPEPVKAHINKFEENGRLLKQYVNSETGEVIETVDVTPMPRVRTEFTKEEICGQFEVIAKATQECAQEMVSTTAWQDSPLVAKIKALLSELEATAVGSDLSGNERS